MILRLLQTTVDGFYATVPRRPANAKALRECKVIAHRGQHDRNRTVEENTVAAFQVCLDAGVWGIEMDIQWTRDGEPVILHDEHGLRVFNAASICPGEMTFVELQRKCPAIPSLQQVIDVFGGKIHLMLELKPHGFKPDYAGRLMSLLRPLQAGEDYHLLSLIPEFFD
ncbi:MAG: glycerophosphodiester phosphodiesterase, partial [Gammaproteobacteria bacterium]|nr:glycerophosphodiester phosphodiesterase [Gammaproteobacteria bacterium]